MRIEALTAQTVERYHKEIAEFYYKNARLCSCLSHYTYDEAFEKIRNLVNHLTDYTAIAYGAFEGSEIIGFIWAYVHQFREELRVYVSEIRVKEGYRKQGLGSQLLKLVEDKARELGIDALYLHAEADNKEAVRFYQRCGYIIERIQMRKDIRSKDNQNYVKE